MAQECDTGIPGVGKIPWGSHFCNFYDNQIDLADCLLRQALGDTYVRSTIAVATPSAHPSILKLIWREGIRKKS